MDEQTLVTQLHGVGPALAKKFAHLGIKTVADLIDYYPFRYDDYSSLLPIAGLIPGQVTIAAKIVSAQGKYVRRGMHITEAVAEDETGSVRLIWFNQPYRSASIKIGQSYFVSGNFELSHQRLSIANPSIELVSDFPLNTARIVPIYHETKGLSSRQIRAVIEQTLSVIAALPESLPTWLLKRYNLMTRSEALRAMHFPNSSEELQRAQDRLGFEEVFALTLSASLLKEDMQLAVAPPVPFEEGVAKSFVQHLPFKLTDAQRRVCWQIFKDMERAHPMNRLVEGDVGAGKTVVAAMAAAMVLHHGHQVALMAPTEILARQHAETMYKLLEPMGYGRMVGLLVGGMNQKQKQQARDKIAHGELRCIIGTHALIQDSVDMSGLELVVIDEQHRFGVNQRKALQAKAGHMPHVLSLTATPIPRTLALTLYGELDISILNAKPAGRSEIITQIISPNSRDQLHQDIAREMAAGRQVFVVCPLISESDKLPIASAEQTYQRLQKEFKDYGVDLLHGKMKSEEKNLVMQRFVDGETAMLVSTTVIEVGVDVPNATVMVIEAADRFGLAQIHQLRGRVGRGGHQGYCYLVMSDSSAPSRRLRALESSSDGFKLAELDLELRGPGAIYGSLQHGALDLRIAKLTDSQLIARAREAAAACIEKKENLVQYPYLQKQLARIAAVTSLN